MKQKYVRILILAAVLVLALSITIPTAAERNNPNQANGKYKYQEPFEDGVYLVQMLDDPIVAYEGGLTGLKATKPEQGQKINPKSGNVVKYKNHLLASHEDALSKAGGGEKFYDYTFVFNGFAAQLTGPQATKLAAMPDVLSVERDEMMQIDTASTPDFLGLTDEGGLWDQLGGMEKAGEDVIIGIIDTGLWPEHPSFSDQLDLVDRPGSSGKRTQAYGPAPAGWHGDCESGELWSQDDCNNKIIGARYYLSGFGHYGIVQNDYKSPRDYDGHGSHTASTAGGNYGVQLTGDAAILGGISGMAPRARLAVYKVCWNGNDGGCATSDSVAAIDQAVADGVDVLNFSISGTTTNFLSSVEVAFLFAADAGVFVAASAGNSGPTASTVAHPSPWLTTVAASTHDRYYEGYVTLGDGSTFYGASANTTGAGPADLVYSADVGLAGADAEQARLCYPGTLDPALVTGKIVLCDRGDIARVDKSYAVMLAGGIGMIHTNVGPGSINADFHSVPTVHVESADGDVIRSYIASDTAPTAEIFPGYFKPAPAPFIAGFSSRGPSLASFDQIKPDISAPGVDIMAAVAPPSNGGSLFASYQGTSMSSPHIAGLGALMKQAHPDWSPAMIKSAMMTTAYDLLSGPNPFHQGAGHVQPNAMVDPGLVYDNGFFDWLAFLCGTTNGVSAGTCNFLASIGFSTEPSDLNLASMAIGDLAGEQTITRTVTNVGDSTETYAFSYSLDGIDVTANPASFTLTPGESQTFELTFVTTSATLNQFATGFVYWTGDQGHIARSPVAVKPVALAAPSAIFGDGGPLSFDVTFGYTGSFSVEARGLVPAMTEEGNVVDDPTNDINTALGTDVGVTWHAVDIPAGTTYARFSLFDDFTDGDDDLDLYVWYPTGAYAGGSGSGTSAEEVNLTNPIAGTYYVAVHGWQTDGPDSNYTLFSWALGSADEANMTITAPAAATLGGGGSIGLAFTGLDAGTKYLGSIVYSGASGMPNPTIVRIDTP